MLGGTLPPACRPSSHHPISPRPASDQRPRRARRMGWEIRPKPMPISASTHRPMCGMRNMPMGFLMVFLGRVDRDFRVALHRPSLLGPDPMVRIFWPLQPPRRFSVALRHCHVARGDPAWDSFSSSRPMGDGAVSPSPPQSDQDSGPHPTVHEARPLQVIVLSREGWRQRCFKSVPHLLHHCSTRGRVALPHFWPLRPIARI